MVGNSSSGLIEAPSFGLPVVNVGSRQRGRLRAANVIDVEPAPRRDRGRHSPRARSRPSARASPASSIPTATGTPRRASPRCWPRSSWARACSASASSICREDRVPRLAQGLPEGHGLPDPGGPRARPRGGAARDPGEQKPGEAATAADLGHWPAARVVDHRRGEPLLPLLQAQRVEALVGPSLHFVLNALGRSRDMAARSAAGVRLYSVDYALETLTSDPDAYRVIDGRSTPPSTSAGCTGISRRDRFDARGPGGEPGGAERGVRLHHARPARARGPGRGAATARARSGSSGRAPDVAQDGRCRSPGGATCGATAPRCCGWPGRWPPARAASCPRSGTGNGYRRPGRRSVRDFCRRTGAALVVKSREKNRDPRFLRRSAPTCSSRATTACLPYTSIELMAIADLCIHFQSGAVLEAALAGVPSLSVKVPQSHLRGLPRARGGVRRARGQPAELRGRRLERGARRGAAPARPADPRRLQDRPGGAAALLERFVGFDDDRAAASGCWTSSSGDPDSASPPGQQQLGHREVQLRVDVHRGLARHDVGRGGARVEGPLRAEHRNVDGVDAPVRAVRPRQLLAVVRRGRPRGTASAGAGPRPRASSRAGSRARSPPPPPPRRDRPAARRSRSPMCAARRSGAVAGSSTTTSAAKRSCRASQSTAWSATSTVELRSPASSAGRTKGAAHPACRPAARMSAILAGEDRAAQRGAGEGGLDGVHDERLAAQRQEVLAGQPLRAAARHDHARARARPVIARLRLGARPASASAVDDQVEPRLAREPAAGVVESPALLRARARGRAAAPRPPAARRPGRGRRRPRRGWPCRCMSRMKRRISSVVSRKRTAPSGSRLHAPRNA